MVSLLEDQQPAKPRMRFKGGVWSCASLRMAGGSLFWCVGYGYTPEEAFKDWRNQRGISN
jgi:hypothetical protein